MVQDGLRVRVRLSPKASANRITGVMETPEGLTLKVLVTAQPEKGKANAALVKLVAKQLGIKKGQIDLVSGRTSRNKILKFKGDGPTLRKQLEGLLRTLDGRGKHDQRKHH